MKSVWVCAWLLLGSVSATQAQVQAAKPIFDTDNAAPDFSATSAARATLPALLAVTDSLALPRVTSSPHLDTVLPASRPQASGAQPSPKLRAVSSETPRAASASRAIRPSVGFQS